MATVARANLSTILAALKTQLVGQSVATADQIYLVDDDDTADLSMTLLGILLRPRGEMPVRGVQEAAGRVDRRVRRKLAVILYTQLALDPAGRADIRLTDAAQGHYTVEDRIVDALDTFQPADAGSGDALTYEPLAFLGITQTVFQANGWTKSVLDFDIPYVRNLNQNLQ